jgi:hypothetical protein
MLQQILEIRESLTSSLQQHQKAWQSQKNWFNQQQHALHEMAQNQQRWLEQQFDFLHQQHVFWNDRMNTMWAGLVGSPSQVTPESEKRQALPVRAQLKRGDSSQTSSESNKVSSPAAVRRKDFQDDVESIPSPESAVKPQDASRRVTMEEKANKPAAAAKRPDHPQPEAPPAPPVDPRAIQRPWQQKPATTKKNPPLNNATNRAEVGWMSNEPARAFMRPDPNRRASAPAPSNSTWQSAQPKQQRCSLPPPPVAARPVNYDALWDDSQSQQPTYAYQERVRSKAERQRLPTYDCPECRAFYANLNDSQIDPSEYCRHRARHPPPETPPDFWEVDFIDEVRAREAAGCIASESTEPRVGQHER